MGGGIAQVCAQAGYSVVMRDLTDEILDKGLKAIQWSVGKMVEKGKVQGTTEAIWPHPEDHRAFGGSGCNFGFFQAVIENMDAKRALFSSSTRSAPRTPSSGPRPLFP